MDKSPDAFRTISEVAEHIDTPAHVLRFWESRFPQIKPVKRAGGRRYYRPSDIALLSGIKHLLHDEGMTIRGVQKILREHGVRHVAGMTEEDAAVDAPPATVVDLPKVKAAPPKPKVEAPPPEPKVKTAPETVEAAVVEVPEIASLPVGTQAVLPFANELPIAPKAESPALKDAAKVTEAVPPAPNEVEPDHTVAARIRALPLDALMRKQPEISRIASRLSQLRAKLAAHNSPPRS
jgi:DNA-binding transcriptional MerR regulator